MNRSDPSWKSLHRRVRARVRRKVSANDVDDVTQEALLRMHRGLALVRDTRATPGWMVSVIRGAIADFHRRRLVEPEPDAAPPDEPSVLALVAQFVPAFVELVPEPYREALRLTDLQDRRQTDVARELGIPLATLKSRVQRGRAHLREQLERCCTFEHDGRHVDDIRPRTLAGTTGSLAVAERATRR